MRLLLGVEDRVRLLVDEDACFLSRIWFRLGSDHGFFKIIRQENNLGHVISMVGTFEAAERYNDVSHVSLLLKLGAVTQICVTGSILRRPTVVLLVTVFRVGASFANNPVCR